MVVDLTLPLESHRFNGATRLSKTETVRGCKKQEVGGRNGDSTTR
jgi:hypothetical protein